MSAHPTASESHLLHLDEKIRAQREARERARSRAEYNRLHDSRALWIRSFNRLEKAVADDLAHAHQAVMRDLGPTGGG